MRHLSIKYCFFLLFTLLFSVNGNGQCAFEGDVIIQDLDTTSIPVYVTGAVNNDLSTNNGLKAVTVHFKHQFIGDIIIELVSPSGQKVTLVGPSETISPSTSLVTCWNVEFFANSLLAIPDSGYDPIWNSLQTWLGFTTYVGKYYPYMGQLEDFDTGAVNGIWTLNIIDNVQFGDGHIYCFNLAFCEEEGIDQQTCSLVEHNLEENTVMGCEGDPNLNLSIDPIFNQAYDPGVYGYSYALFKDGQFYAIQSGLDLTTFDSGTYSVCGIHYFLEDLSALGNISQGESKLDVEAFIIENGICASISNECVSVIIYSFPEVITENVSLCFGDTIFINGNPYFETGTYEIFNPATPCDSTSYLELTINEVNVIVNSQMDTLTCDNPSTLLDGSFTELPDDASILWTTMDGNFISNPQLAVVEVDRRGTYTFQVSLNGCIFSEEVVIVESDDFVRVKLSANTLTCILDSTFIDLTVSDTLDSISWSGPFEFSALNEDIRVGNGGIYTVYFETNYGCEVTREFEVFEERDHANLTIIGDTLSCTKSEVVLSTFPNDTLGSSFQWYFDGGLLSTDTFQIVSDPGRYFVEVTTALGCRDTISYEVISQFREIDVELISDTIDCNNSFVNIAYTSSIQDLNALWKLPSGDLVIDSSFNSSEVGTFNLNLSDSMGCILDTFLTVNIDNMLPEVTIFDASFFCGDDSIQLSAQVNFDDLSYMWQGPGGVIDTDVEPFIFSPGTYILEVCRPNGCCAKDSVEVGIDNTIPIIDFEFEQLNCINDTVYIIPSDTSSYLLEWSLNNSSLVVDSNIIEVTSAGYYEVLVTDEINGCKSLYSFNITSDKYDKIESLNADILNCVNTEVQISVSSIRTFDSYVWSGPGLLDNNLEPLVDTEGQYIIEYTYTNGCSGSDTIEVKKEGELPNLQGEDVTITCFEDEVTLSVEYSSSSIVLNWTGPDDFVGTGSSVQASQPGMYSVIGIASGSCRDTIEIELIGDLLSPIVSIEEDGEITCADSIVFISSTIDMNTEFYEISGPEVNDPSNLNFEVSSPGIYMIEAIGFNGCTSSASVEVKQSTDFPDYNINLDSLTCDINSVEVGFESSDPNLSVFWQGPVEVIDNEYNFITSQAGNYIFSITNSNGCKLTDSFFVVMDTFPPESEILLSSHINCLTDSVTLSISNYYEDLDVMWSGPGVLNPASPQFTTGEVGDYSLTLKSKNGCITEDNITVQYDTISPEILVIGNPINCLAGKTFLKVESDLTLAFYNWTGPNSFNSNDAEPLVFEEGLYHVTVTAINGCTTNDSILVEDERDFPDLEIGDFYLPCNGSPEAVFANFISAGSVVHWFGPNNYYSEEDTAFVLVAGEYIGIAFNGEGCTRSDTFQVIDEPILPEFGGFSELLLCLGPVAITATEVEDDGSLYWNGPNGFYSEDNPTMVDEAGTYQLVVTSTRGCVDSMEIEVLDGRIYPEASASLNGLFQCQNLEVNLSAEGSSTGDIYSYQWTTENGNIIDGSNTLSPMINEEGTYVLEVTNNSIGCASYDTLIVQLQEQDLKGAEIEIVKPTCLDFGNGEINLIEIIGGYGPFNISVDGFDYGERMDIEYLASGEHLVSIIDSLGCQHDTLVVIPNEGLLFVDLPSDTTLCFGDSILIQPIISLSADSIQSIVWSSNIPCDGCDEFQLFLNQDITVSIVVTDINNCIAEDEFNIKVNRPNNLPFPQIFSPNGDDINDVFYMPMTKGLSIINYIKIYDNWGGLLYFEKELSPGDITNGWKGIVNGKNAEQGVYIVEALVTLVDGSEVIYVGDLTLIR